MLSKRGAIATGAIAMLAITQGPRPAEANPAIAAPAACATGVGCVLLGTVVIGGAIYYVWQNRSTGREFYSPIWPQDREDLDAEGRDWDSGESSPFYERDYRSALRRCRARGYRGVREIPEYGSRPASGARYRYYVCY